MAALYRSRTRRSVPVPLHILQRPGGVRHFVWSADILSLREDETVHEESEDILRGTGPYRRRRATDRRYEVRAPVSQFGAGVVDLVWSETMQAMEQKRYGQL